MVEITQLLDGKKSAINLGKNNHDSWGRVCDVNRSIHEILQRAVAFFLLLYILIDQQVVAPAPLIGKSKNLL